MENNHVMLGVLIFILLILGSNLVMYGIVRGVTKSGDSNWLNIFRKSFEKPLGGSAKKSMDELRKKVDELQEKEKT